MAGWSARVQNGFQDAAEGFDGPIQSSCLHAIRRHIGFLKGRPPLRVVKKEAKDWRRPDGY
jgi:hypothetical protein